jgi:hypothetical protein
LNLRQSPVREKLKSLSAYHSMDHLQDISWQLPVFFVDVERESEHFLAPLLRAYLMP